MDKRKVSVFEYDRSKPMKSKGGYQLTKVGVGVFHGWGCDYEEFDTGPGNYSIAIIEMPDGTVISHPVDLIRFESDQ